ncbi:MAG TPA: LptF/LptG family permease [Flavipsychrobacter sp.]|nr:LptF/LptG family permease [Flavipsychrobacter sp.]
MIKKLDILIIRSFVGPFIVTFFVSLFVLVMQFFWLYMDELIGKGLGIWMILQLLFYMSATMVPLALPLGILLASIMTFGNLGESFELVAIKSAGISLLRFMRPLLLVIICLGGFAFLFNNNIIPVANLKALSLLYDLRNSKPSLNIRAGQFNKDIEGFSIRVGEKDKDGHTIRDVLIYDHSSGYGNDNVVIAKEGDMIPSTNKQVLVFRLKEGWRYDEGAMRGGAQGYEQKRIYFKKWDKVFDLSSFKLSRTNEDLFKGAYQMMNIRQLNEGIDSLRRDEKKVPKSVSSYLSPYISLGMFAEDEENFRQKLDSNKSMIKYDSTFLAHIPDTLRTQVIDLAMSHIRNSKGLLDISASDKKIKTENFIKYQIEWHRKFTLSFACVLLFLIGAPLGAIIRKGGVGMPMIIAIAFFILFHIMTIVGEKLAKSAALDPLPGMWMATVMLLPIAFFLINAARKDSQIFSKEMYVRVWSRTRKLFVKS